MFSQTLAARKEAQVEAASRSAAHLAKSTGQYVLEKAAAI
jgi:hypothetical protein